MQISLCDYKELVCLKSREKKKNTHEEAEEKRKKKRKMKEKMIFINFRSAKLL